MINEYVEIADYYDNLLTSGYFDFDSLSNILYNLLGGRRKVLDIGVGTGLLTEKMLSLANYQIVGVDFSPRMLEIAKNKLANSDVKLICQDITEFETEEKFEAIVSTGGVICVVEEDGEYKIYSHLTKSEVRSQKSEVVFVTGIYAPLQKHFALKGGVLDPFFLIIDPEKNKQLLKKLHSQLDEGGFLALGIQGSHSNYQKEIKDEIFYEQKIKKEGNYVDKWYVFSEANGEIIGEQFCRFYVFDGKQTNQVLIDAGFQQGFQIIDGKFLVSYK